jgi:hypothetical protein
MAIEGRRYAGRKNQELVSKEDIDEELADIRAEIEKLALWMQQNARMDELALEIQKKAKSRWVYEWPMRKLKVKWPVKELMARRQRRLLRGWLRHAENLNRPKKRVQICEPETGRSLSSKDEMGLAEYLKHC